MTKFFRFLNREINGLHQAAFLLASASIGAKLLAILRDRLLASTFGAGKTLDIYYASFRVPDLLYVFSLFLVSVTALIPLFLEKKDRHFINSIFTVFFVCILFLAVLLFFLLPCLAPIIAPGFSIDDSKIFIDFSRILLLSPLLLGLSNLASGVVQSFKRFFVYALSGVLYNVGIIFGLLFLYPKFGLIGVVWGVVVGALLHFLIQVPSLINLGYFPKFVFDISFMEIKKVISLSLPRTLGLTLNQLVLTVITALASFLAAGSIAVFNLAANLQAIPISVIALSYSVAAFPSLASNFIKKEREKFLLSVVSSFRHIFFWLLPASILFIVLRAQIVRVVLGAGAFTWTDTRLTAAALALFSFSLLAQGLILLLVRAFYAASKTKIPLIINIISSSFIILFSFLFIYLLKNFSFFQELFRRLLRVEDIGGVSVLMLALAYSLGTILNFLLLFIFFEKELGSILKFIKKSIVQICLTSIIMGIIAYVSLGIFASVFDQATFVGIFMQGFLSGLLALFVGFCLFKLLKNQEFEELASSFKKRFIKKPPVLVKPEPEELP
ncbi:murein biosynthesis integral membrane protein MurJ [Patescibacteria group bacterium]